MKRFIIFLIILLILSGIYNFTILKNSFIGFFGDSSYKKEELLTAQKYYENIINTQSGKTLQKADLLYNLGNTLYRLGEKETSEKRMQLWKESLGNFTKSLSIRTDKETEENLAYIQERINQEKQKQEKEKQDEQENQEKKEQNANNIGTEEDGSSESKSGSGNNSEDNKQDSGDENKGDVEEKSHSSETPSQSGKTWSNQGSYKPLPGTEKDFTPLTEGEKQDVQKYIEDLKQFEKQNGKLFNPEKEDIKGSISDQIRNFFGADSFFQDVLPTNDGKKDW